MSRTKQTLAFQLGHAPRMAHTPDSQLLPSFTNSNFSRLGLACLDLSDLLSFAREKRLLQSRSL